ncbi:MAG: conjugal transfer protein TrbK [Rhodopseudomonas palustris]|nr:MAG: conjugal transfer protein TrbK [Rhodopseudomonas palustris]
MTKRSKLNRLTMLAGVVTTAFIAVACTIPLRDPEQSPTASPAAEHPDPLATELARCRTLTIEQKDAVVSCRRLWAEQRRQFLRQKLTPPPAGLLDDEARNTQLPVQAPRKDDSRVPQGWPSVPSWQGE